jgi:hypothetical protein
MRERTREMKNKEVRKKRTREQKESEEVSLKKRF